MENLFPTPGIKPDDARVASGVKQLANIGVRAGGVLLVHSSFRSVKAEAGSIERVIAALAGALGQSGTLLIPALSYDEVTRDKPVFDVDRTPSNIGVLPEFFRTHPATRRSVHPTHSVCGCGFAANDILSSHDLDTTPVGAHSPFRAVRDRGGQILMLGCGLEPNTSMHGIEEIAEAPYIFSNDPITYTIRDGNRECKSVHKRHSFRDIVQRYDRVKDVLDRRALKTGTVFGAESWLIEASELWSACALQIKTDPYYFIEETSKNHL